MLLWPGGSCGSLILGLPPSATPGENRDVGSEVGDDDLEYLIKDAHLRLTPEELAANNRWCRMMGPCAVLASGFATTANFPACNTSWHR